MDWKVDTKNHLRIRKITTYHFSMKSQQLPMVAGCKQHIKRCEAQHEMHHVTTVRIDKASLTVMANDAMGKRKKKKKRIFSVNKLTPICQRISKIFPPQITLSLSP